jgi:hypothetical protein
MTLYYVSTTGNNANAGTTTAGAWASIARAGSAASVVTVGDTVIVLGGTYNISGFATAKANITYQALTKQAAIITGLGSGDSSASILWNNSGNGVTIDGFDLSTHGRIGYYSTGNDCVTKNCYVHDVLCQGSPTSGGAGIDCIGARWQVFNNLVCRIDAAHVTGTAQIQGIYCGGTSAVVYNNIVFDIAAYGLHQWHGADESFFYNNTVGNCGAGGIIIGSGDSGQLPNGSTDNKVYNNISVFNGAYGIRELGLVGSNVYVNNMLFGHSSANQFATDGDNPAQDGVESGRISKSATFINYVDDGTGDYHLSSTSLAIGAANTAYVPSTDYDGVARPQGGAYDVGALEYTGVPDPPPPPPPAGSNSYAFGGRNRRTFRF